MVCRSRYECLQHTLTSIVFFPNSGHRVASYTVEGHMIADIKVNPSTPAPTLPQPLPPPSGPPAYSQYPQAHAQRQSQHMGPQAPHLVSQPSTILPPSASAYQNARQASRQPAPQPAQAAPFVDPAILSMGKRTSTAPSLGPASAPPQEAPATPIKPVAAASAPGLPKNTSTFVGHAKQHNVRKPSAATLEGPFSSLDIQDAEEADSETRAAQVTARRASITKTRTGKPMDDPSPQKNDENGKKTRRGGKSRKKELAAQERKNGDVEAVKKGYVRF
jgi:enhancer of mRNA-decapping protein 3